MLEPWALVAVAALVVVMTEPLEVMVATTEAAEETAEPEPEPEPEPGAPVTWGVPVEAK